MCDKPLILNFKLVLEQFYPVLDWTHNQNYFSGLILQQTFISDDPLPLNHFGEHLPLYCSFYPLLLNCSNNLCLHLNLKLGLKIRVSYCWTLFTKIRNPRTHATTPKISLIRENYLWSLIFFDNARWLSLGRAKLLLSSLLILVTSWWSHDHADEVYYPCDHSGEVLIWFAISFLLPRSSTLFYHKLNRLRDIYGCLVTSVLVGCGSAVCWESLILNLAFLNYGPEVYFVQVVLRIFSSSVSGFLKFQNIA